MKKLIVLLTSVLLCFSAFNSKAATYVDKNITCEIITHALRAAENKTEFFNEYTKTLDLECFDIYIAIYTKRKDELKNGRGLHYTIEHYLMYLENRTTDYDRKR